MTTGPTFENHHELGMPASEPPGTSNFHIELYGTIDAANIQKLRIRLEHALKTAGWRVDWYEQIGPLTSDIVTSRTAFVEPTESYEATYHLAELALFRHPMLHIQGVPFVARLNLDRAVAHGFRLHVEALISEPPAEWPALWELSDRIVQALSQMLRSFELMPIVQVVRFRSANASPRPESNITEETVNGLCALPSANLIAVSKINSDLWAKFKIGSDERLLTLGSGEIDRQAVLPLYCSHLAKRAIGDLIDDCNRLWQDRISAMSDQVASFNIESSQSMQSLTTLFMRSALLSKTQMEFHRIKSDVEVVKAFYHLYCDNALTGSGVGLTSGHLPEIQHIERLDMESFYINRLRHTISRTEEILNIGREAISTEVGLATSKTDLLGRVDKGILRQAVM